MRKKSININKIINYFDQQQIDEKKLNKLFYYSLFNSSIFESREEFFPVTSVKKFREETIKLLKDIFSKKKHPEIYNFLNSQYFDEFEKKVIATDLLSRILLKKQLLQLGIKAEIDKSGKYDLKIQNNIIIELKRFCLWSNYSEETIEFLKKAKQEKDKCFIYLVVHAPPLVFKEKIIEGKHLQIFYKYIEKIVKSNYVIERLIEEKLINLKNVKFIIWCIDRDGKEKFNLQNLCDALKQKIEKFGENHE